MTRSPSHLLRRALAAVALCDGFQPAPEPPKALRGALLPAARARLRSRFPGGLRRHLIPELAIALEGQGAMEIEDSARPFAYPAAVLIAPGSLHGENCGTLSAPYTALWLVGHGPSMMALVSRHRPRGGWDSPWRCTLRGPEARRLTAAMAAAAGGGAGDEDLRAATLSFLARLLALEARPAAGGRRALPGREPHAAMLLQIRSFLDDHLERPVTVSEAAALARLSPRYLNRLFRAWCGEAIHEYLARRRMERALALCRDGSLLVKEIAARTGYRDPLYFCRAFRQYHGRSVTETRAAERAARHGNTEARP